MGLIDSIDGSLVRSLGGSQRSASSSSIGSLSTSGAKVDLSAAAQRFAEAFQSSAIRVDQSTRVFRIAQRSLEELLAITDKLIPLADAAADPVASEQDRTRLNSQFRSLIQDFEDVLAGAEQDGINFLDKGTLERALQTSGISTAAATQLSAAFNQISRTDSQLGHRMVGGEDEVFTEDSGAGAIFDFATAPRDPLDNSIRTRAEATVSSKSLRTLRSDILNDLTKVRQVGSELRAAADFAVTGFRASEGIAAELANITSAQKFAETLASRIRSGSRDGRLSEHSSLDRALSAELLAG